MPWRRGHLQRCTEFSGVSRNQRRGLHKNLCITPFIFYVLSFSLCAKTAQVPHGGDKKNMLGRQSFHGP